MVKILRQNVVHRYLYQMELIMTARAMEYRVSNTVLLVRMKWANSYEQQKQCSTILP